MELACVATVVDGVILAVAIIHIHLLVHLRKQHVVLLVVDSRNVQSLFVPLIPAWERVKQVQLLRLTQLDVEPPANLQKVLKKDLASVVYLS